MAAAWSGNVDTDFSSSQLVSLLFSSAQLAAAPAAAQLEAAADAAVLAALGDDAGNEDAAAAAGASQGSQRKQKQQQLSAADIVRVLWSLAVLDALDIARLGWLLVALAGANWQRLEQEQLLVVKQAQVRGPHCLLCWCWHCWAGLPLCLTVALDIARLGWLLVALAGANGQKLGRLLVVLEQEQLLVVKQAQVRGPHCLLCWCLHW
jgi:hypothetical protein